MSKSIALSNRLEERFIDFAVEIVHLAGRMPARFQARHIAKQVLRSGTSPAPNYAEARSAESRADFIHKIRIVQKELNETAVWLRIIQKTALVSDTHLARILSENRELSRIITATVRTARLRQLGRERPPSNEK